MYINTTGHMYICILEYKGLIKASGMVTNEDERLQVQDCIIQTSKSCKAKGQYIFFL